jgi:penicillin-binding protein 1A
MADFRTLPDNKNVNNYAIRSEKHETVARWMWRIFYGVAAVVALSVITFYFTTPSFKSLEDPSMNLASEVIAQDDSTVLGRLYIENRAPVKYENIPKHMVKALLATEDSRFYEHSGVDPEALGRVFVKTFLMAQKGQGGGSTLTMQLSKLLYSDRDFKNMNFIEKAFGYYYRKISEMITAFKLERAYTKEEIITMYLNTYDFGYNAHGIRAASEVYFGKAPEQLTVEEGATLVGMCNNSSYYNPVRRNEKTRARRNLVLGRAREQNYLTEAQFKEYSNKPLDISKFRTRSHNDGLATYFRSTLADSVKQILKASNITKPDGSTYDVYRDGLKIHTTIDAEMQRIAEESLQEHMATLQAKYFKVWRGRDPWTYKDEETTDDQIRSRLASLDGHIRESNRYQLMRGRYLDEVITTIEKAFDKLDLMDSDIINMLRQEKQPGLFDTMLKTNSISGKKVDIYREIMASNEWKTLRSQWNKLQSDIRLDFNKPTKMKVFAYNSAGDKDTTMTPLDSVRYHRMHLQLGSMGVDPVTGQVKFWVGGIGHKYYQLDHVKVDRQVGSTFKPFIYVTAISDFGISPCTTVHDVAQTIGVGEGSFGLITPYTPKNSGGYSGEYTSLWDALKESRNTASVYLMKQIGSTQPVREKLREMGVEIDAKYSNGQLRLPKSPSICLGAADLTVLEMTGAYSTFANSGTYTKPLFIRKITDKSGKVIYQGTPKRQSALPENAAYVMLQMLKYNVRSAPGIKNLKTEVGGKTGTTNDYRDGWFMGVTPRLVVGTWVGGEDQWIRFLRIEDGQGGAMARPYFAKVMDKIEKSTVINFDKTVKFKKPEGALGITLDCGDYFRDDSGNGAPTEGGDESKPFNADQFQDEEAITPTAPKPAAAPITPPKPGGKPIINPKSIPATKPDDGFNE